MDLNNNISVIEYNISADFKYWDLKLRKDMPYIQRNIVASFLSNFRHRKAISV